MLSPWVKVTNPIRSVPSVASPRVGETSDSIEVEIPVQVAALKSPTCPCFVGVLVDGTSESTATRVPCVAVRIRSRVVYLMFRIRGSLEPESLSTGEFYLRVQCA